MSDTRPSETTAPPEIRFRISPQMSRFGHTMPDVILAMLFALGALLGMLPAERTAWIPAGFRESLDDLSIALFVEGGLLLFQGTLIDVATRIKKRPSPALAIVIVIVLMLFLGQPLEVLRGAWAMGPFVFFPLLLTIFERGSVLWKLPLRSPIEKIAARALIGNRIVAGLGLFGIFAISAIIVVALTPYEWPDDSLPAMLAGAIYFGMAAFDDVRVRGRRFAENPTVLLGFDPLGVKYLDPI